MVIGCFRIQPRCVVREGGMCSATSAENGRQPYYAQTSELSDSYCHVYNYNPIFLFCYAKTCRSYSNKQHKCDDFKALYMGRYRFAIEFVAGNDVNDLRQGR